MFYGARERHGFEIDFTKGGLIGIFQSRMGEDCNLALDPEEAEALILELRRFLDDVANGNIEPPEAEE